VQKDNRPVARVNGTTPAAVKTSLNKHFHSIKPIVALMVANMLQSICDYAQDAQYECHESETNGSALAESMWCVPYKDIELYKRWFKASGKTRANTLVHEWSHRYGCTFGLGYDWEDSYGSSGTFRALNNAEPYGNIVADLG
jgi:hypothetical protein